MSTYSRSHLSDESLKRSLADHITREKVATAELLADVAEFDRRRLYLPEGYSSTFLYCVREFHLSEPAAYRRITAARAARKFPLIFPAVADGRLHLSAVSLLAPHLTRENASALIQAATHKSKREIEGLIAERFPGPDVPASLRPVRESPRSVTSLDLLSTDVQETLTESEDQLVPGRVEASHQERVEPPKLRAILRPLAPQRFYLKVTLGQDTHDMLLYAQRLLSLQVEPGDVAAVIHRALQTLIQRLEKQEFAATSAPRQGRLTSEQGRAISAQVRRTVWERDGGQCTFVSDAGHRCESRSALEFDHALAFARGGKPTAENIRLLCRAHNQHAAELTFGSGFMEGKREFRMAGQRHR